MYGAGMASWCHGWSVGPMCARNQPASRLAMTTRVHRSCPDCTSRQWSSSLVPHGVRRSGGTPCGPGSDRCRNRSRCARRVSLLDSGWYGLVPTPVGRVRIGRKAKVTQKWPFERSCPDLSSLLDHLLPSLCTALCGNLAPDPHSASPQSPTQPSRLVRKHQFLNLNFWLRSEL